MPSPVSTGLSALLALLTPLAVGQEVEPDPAAAREIAAAREFATDLDTTQAAARAVARLLTASLGAALLEGNLERLSRALSADFRGRFPAAGAGRQISSGAVRLELVEPAALPELERADWLAAAGAELAAWGSIERTRTELVGLQLEGEDGSALATARWTLAGTDPDGARAELHAELELRLERGPGSTWRIARLEPRSAHRAHAEGAGFVDVTDEVGFQLNLALPSRALIQQELEALRVGALGGLAVLDWNDDGFWDLAVTRHAQLAQLFVNDGQGGFRRESLPLGRPGAAPDALLFLDLDGDGRAELVSGHVAGYEGERAWLEVHTRRSGAWERLERALEFELRAGVRGVRVQGLVPADVDGDGLLDLFVCVERDTRSVGGESMPLGAFDGGDNLLFMNQGDLVFREESDLRGLEGRQYTTCALILDVDGDGDPDLFEGNRWGPDWLYGNSGAGHFELWPDHPLSSRASDACGVSVSEEPEGLELFVATPFLPSVLRVVGAARGLLDELRARGLEMGAGGRLYSRAREGGAWSRIDPGGDAAATGWAWGGVFFDLDNDGARELFVTTGHATHRDPAAPSYESLHALQILADAAALQSGEPRRPVSPEAQSKFVGSFAGRQRDRLLVRDDGEPLRRYEAGHALAVDLMHDGRAAAALDFDGDGDLDLALHGVQGLHLLENRAPGGRFVRLALESPRGAAGVLGAEVELEAAGRRQRDVVRVTEGRATQRPLELHFGLGAAESLERVRVRWPGGETQQWSDLPVDVRVVLREGAAEARSAPLPAWPDERRPRALSGLRADVKAPRVGGRAGTLAMTGRAAVVHFWRHGDEEAPLELARLAALDEELGGHVRFAAVCVGAPSAELLAAELEEHGLERAQFLAEPALVERFLGAGEETPLPATFVFDPDGRLRRAYRRRVDPDELRGLLDSLLDEEVFVELFLRLAERQLADGDGEEALATLRRVLQAEPRNAQAHHTLGKLYVLLGRVAEAEVAFGRAVEFDPGLAAAQHNLGTARLALGRADEAVAAFEAAWQLRGDELQTLLALGGAFVQAGELEQALATYERALEIHPEQPMAWFLHGRILVDLGRVDEGRAALERALELQPDLEPARRALAELDG